MKKIFTIYKATNIVNGKAYIGKTENIWPNRQKDHHYAAYSGSTYYFHRAIKHHGWDNFKWEILYQSWDNQWLKKAETLLIEIHETHSSKGGYNLTYGGEGTSGLKWRKESKKKASLSKKRYIRNHPEYLQHLSIIGKAKTLEGRKIISETTKRSHSHPSETRIAANKNHSKRMSGKNNPAASNWVAIDLAGKKYNIKSIKTFLQTKFGISKGPAYTSQRRKLPIPKGKAKGWQFIRVPI